MTAIRRAAALLRHPSVQGAIALAATGYGLGQLTKLVDEQSGAIRRTDLQLSAKQAELKKVRQLVDEGRGLLTELNAAIVRASAAIPDGGPAVADPAGPGVVDEVPDEDLVDEPDRA